MKKTFLIACLCAGLAMASCGSNKANEENSESLDTVAPDNQSTTYGSDTSSVTDSNSNSTTPAGEDRGAGGEHSPIPTDSSSH